MGLETSGKLNPSRVVRDLRISLGGVACIAAILFPEIISIGMVVTLSLWLTICLARFLCTDQKALSKAPSKGYVKDGHPFVSIHVPIYNEPPELVIRTLESLRALSYPNYEVIVLDNNTSDSKLWRPVKAYCNIVGDQFKFFHMENVSGYKAGALNICRRHSHPDTQLFLIVDSDYEVVPTLLRDWIVYLSSTDLGYFQFPQAYRVPTSGKISEDLNENYLKYFESCMPFADSVGAPLLTGTLSLIKKEALDSVGGWSTDSITEDAQTGLRILKAGYRGKYIRAVVGKGIMPQTFSELCKQRLRWGSGNTRTLMELRVKDIRQLGARKTLAIILQLTSWVRPHGIFIAGIFLGSISLVLGREDALASVYTGVAGIVISEVGVITEFIARNRYLRRGMLGLKTCLSISFIETVGLIQGIFIRKQRFHRTSKFEKSAFNEDFMMGHGVLSSSASPRRMNGDICLQTLK